MASNSGKSLPVANQSGFHAVYITLFVISIIGLVIAMMIRNTKKIVNNSKFVLL